MCYIVSDDILLKTKKWKVTTGTANLISFKKKNEPHVRATLYQKL